jgi:hypothetical protein
VIEWLPHESETLIVGHDWDVVLQRLGNASSPEIIEQGRTPTALTGWIKDDRFQLMLRQRRPNSFTPVMEGKIDPTSSGCIIFLHYKLMPVTRMYLILWTCIVLLSVLILLFYYRDINWGLGALGIIVLIHGIAWANFKLHKKPLHDLVFKVLS